MSRPNNTLGALIKKHKLSTAKKYTEFRAQHPELGLPTARAIMRAGVKVLDVNVKKMKARA